MATTNKSAKAPAPRRRLADDDTVTNGSLRMQSNAELEAEEKALASGMVIVSVPKAFELTRDGHVSKKYAAGTQEMPRLDAEHWFSKAQGVTIFTGSATAKAPH